MKIRTTEQLVDAVAAELSWRRKELTDLRYLVQQSVGSLTRQRVMTRSAVALLYAHWEGFVKSAAETYLEFVCMQRCKNSELAASMVAIVILSKLRAAAASKRIAAHLDIVEFFRSQMKERGVLPYKNAIRTDANLSSTVLLDILKTLGMDATGYESKTHMLDSQLLAKRNHIAHGADLDVGVDDYLRLHEEILALMTLLRNQIENAAQTGQYLSQGTHVGGIP